MHAVNRDRIAAWSRTTQTGDRHDFQHRTSELFTSDAVIRMCAPFGDLTGRDALWSELYAPLLRAMPDIERRDFIVMAGPRWGVDQSGDWVGVGGNFIGTFTQPWLGIPPTGRPIYLRYHEYMRFEDGQAVEMEAIWDIPQLMLQAGAWPMAPQLGVEWMCPGPAPSNGVKTGPWDEAASSASVQIVYDMLHDLKKGTAEMPGRGLGGYWHQNAMWYGSTGLGTARGHDGIRDHILSGFRSGLSDNTRHLDDGVFFGDGDLVAFTGWPSGTATHSGDGFLGLAPTGRRVSRRSLDFWRIENGEIHENWVMVDMIDLYRQLGVDVFARMERMN